MNIRAQEELSNVDNLTDEDIDLLIRHGYRSLQELYDADPYEISIILNIDEEQAEELCDYAGDLADQITGSTRSEGDDADEDAEFGDDLGGDGEEPDIIDEDELPEEA